jgi:O-antigen/teichoic acid export membrane protein
MALALLLIVGANRIVVKLLSAKFAASAPVFAIAVVATIFVFVHWVLLQALLSAKMNRQLILTYLAGAGVQVLTGVAFVPRSGATGGAWSYVAGEFTAMLLSGIFAWKCLQWRPSGRMIVVSCCSVALVSAALIGAGHVGGWGMERIHMAANATLCCIRPR